MSGVSTGTGVLRRRSDELRARGEELRRTADELARHADQVPWQGRAAETMRGRVSHRVEDLYAVARAHEEAAEALDRYVEAVLAATGDAPERARPSGGRPGVDPEPDAPEAP